MANTVQIKLLENRTVQALWNGRPIEYEGGYRIVAGEANSTEFQLTAPKTYTVDGIIITGYNAGKQVVKDENIPRNKDYENNTITFTLPNGMAVAGYSSLVFEWEQDGSRTIWTPLKLKIYNTEPDWMSQSVSATQEMLDRLTQAEGAITQLNQTVEQEISKVEGDIETLSDSAIKELSGHGIGIYKNGTENNNSYSITPHIISKDSGSGITILKTGIHLGSGGSVNTAADIAIGHNVTAAQQSIAIGEDASAGFNGTAIGASSIANSGVALGRGSTAEAGITIGYGSRGKDNSILIGNNLSTETSGTTSDNDIYISTTTHTLRLYKDGFFVDGKNYNKGKSGGIASLDESGRVPASELPSYVDDVLEFESLLSFPDDGEDGKIYIATDTNKQYRWSGTDYREISASLALGHTSSTAYPGNEGQANADAIEALQSSLSSLKEQTTQTTELLGTDITDLEANITDLENRLDEQDIELSTCYKLPPGGIPRNDLDSVCNDAINKAINAVLTAPQTLSETQKGTGRSNLGLGTLATKNAIGSGDITNGTIVNEDIATNADIDQSKIKNLTSLLSTKATVTALDAVSAVANGAIQSTGGDERPLYNGQELALYTDVTSLDSSLQSAIDKANTALQDISVTSSGSGNAVTAVVATGGNITVTKGETFAKQADLTTLSGSVTTIEGKIPAQATASNQLADKDFVNSSINNAAAYYLTKNAAGDAFATKAELTAATTFYSGGEIRVPTRNDYVTVIADESHKDSVTGISPTTRYSYNNGEWEFQYAINNSSFTAAQWSALNSGATTTNIGQITINKNDISGLTTRMGSVENKNMSQDTAISEAASAASAAQTTANGKYTKPSGGIPATDLAGSIPKTKLDSGVQTSLGKADTAIQSISANGSNGVTASVSGTVITVKGTAANTNTIGVAKLHSAESCTSYTSDDGGATPNAVKKAIIDDSLKSTFNATSTHRGTMSKEDKAKLDAFGTASTYATKTELNAKYTKPSGGIPKTDLASAVQTSLNAADVLSFIVGTDAVNDNILLGGTEWNDIIVHNSIVPQAGVNGEVDLGDSAGAFRDLYLAGVIVKKSISNTSSYNLILPSKAGTIALTSDIPSLAAVAKSGKYSDLSGTPKIPAAVRLRSNTNSYLTGDITLSAGSNVALSQSGNTITINSSYPSLSKSGSRDNTNYTVKDIDVSGHTITPVYAYGVKSSAHSSTTAPNGSSGYIKIPNGSGSGGVMIQWGTKQTTGASTYTITFNQEFGYTPQVVLSQGSGGSTEGTWVGAIKLTGYTAYGRGFTFQAYQSETMYVNWLAIGGYGTY